MCSYAFTRVESVGCGSTILRMNVCNASQSAVLIFCDKCMISSSPSCRGVGAVKNFGYISLLLPRLPKLPEPMRLK